MLHPNLNREIGLPTENPGSEEGFYVDDLAEGAVVDVETQHRHYKLVKRGDTHVRISGHPTFCPEPVEVEIEGSIRREPTLLPIPGFIGRGMYLVFRHPLFDETITTSRIRGIHKLC